jgi:hypothetical protein
VQVAEVLDCIYSQYALSRGKTRWGDKTPRNIEFYSEITDLFPTAKFLIIIRDCRDVALSLRDVRFGHISAISSATRWANDARRALALQAAYPTQVQITRYEDLLTKPDETLQTMMEFLALRSDVDLQRLYLNHDDDVTHSKSSLYRQPITAQHVGRWRQKISRRDLAICEQIAGSELRRFGYSVELPSTDITPYTIQLGLLKDKLSRLYNVTYLQNYLGFSRLAARRLLEGCVG